MNRHLLSSALVFAFAFLPMVLKPVNATAATIVTENFGGGTGNLNGTTADTFDAAITTVGGSATWVADTTAGATSLFQADGVINYVTGFGAATAFLNMGSYINDAKGTSNGLFTLSATINSTRASNVWVSLGFFDSPTTLSSFTSTGLGTIIQRSPGYLNGGTGSTGLQELDMWGGAGTGTGGVDGPELASGPQLVTIVLDLRTHNNTDDFGTVTWYDGTTAGTNLGSYDYLADNSFDAIGISQAGSDGTVAGLTLEQFQVPEPSTAILAGLGLAGLSLRRRRR
ncbi:MAG: PEP-CTERM sorting domain-containing protein [Lentisphaeria bacterium]|nr:PEP-CTERM sorting domain-containing protein [Lentisphaeria bacterium]